MSWRLTLGSGKLATMAPANLPDTSTIGIILPKDQVAGGPAKMVDWANYVYWVYLSRLEYSIAY